MTGLYIFGALIVVGTVVLFMYRAKWAKAGKVEEQVRETRLAKEREDEVTKEAARTAAALKDG